MIEEFRKDKQKIEKEFLLKLQELEDKYGVRIEDIEFEKIHFGKVMQTEPSYAYNLKIKVSFDAI